MKKMFGADPKASRDLKPGALYAVAGEEGWIYYGQVTPDKCVGFFRRRDRSLAVPETILTAAVMCILCISYASITTALRAGAWKKLGRFGLHDTLAGPHRQVQWPVGTLTVNVWEDDKIIFDTRADDPRIQRLEIMAVYDAMEHIPERLSADFGAEGAAWHIGGPIWRERRVREDYARRFPDHPFHQLPPDWAPSGAQS
ncbi:MAG: hypothetical protein ACLFU3_03105 [Dichotomicrobium sp.]